MLLQSGPGEEDRLEACCASRALGYEVERNSRARVDAVLMSGVQPKLPAGSKRGRDKMVDVWSACALVTELALKELDDAGSGKQQGGCLVSVTALLTDFDVNLEELCCNIKLTMEKSALLSANSPRTRAWTSAFTSASPCRRASQERSDAEKEVLQRLERLQLLSKQMTMLHRKFLEQWELAGNFSSDGLRRSASPMATSMTARATMHCAWYLYIIAQRELRHEELGDGDIAWSFKLLVAIIYMARLSPDLLPSNVSPLCIPEQGVDLLKRKAAQRGGQPPLASKRQKCGADGDDGHHAATASTPPRSLETPMADKYFSRAEVDQREMMEQVEQVRELLSRLLNQGVLGHGWNSLAQLLGAGLSSLQTCQALSTYYAQHILGSITDFDARSLLTQHEATAAAQGQNMQTPLKLFANLSIVNGSHEHQKAKRGVLLPGFGGSTNLGVGGSTSTRVGGEGQGSAKRLTFDDDSSSNNNNNSSSNSNSPNGEYDNQPGERTPPLQPASIKRCIGSPVPPMSLAGSNPHTSPARPGSAARPPAHLMSTPISATIRASNWLHRELDNAPPHASEALRRTFQRELRSNPNDEIEQRIKSMESDLEQLFVAKRPRRTIAAKLFQGPGEQTGGGRRSPSHGVQSYLGYGRRLYFRVLELILHGESQRLEKANFDSMLRNDYFHRALYACCMEVIFRWKEVYFLMYPTLTDCLGVPVLELFNVIESFVTYMQNLPKPLSQHLMLVEINILEESAWRKGSQVFQILADRKAHTLSSACPPASGAWAAKRGERFLRMMLQRAHDRMKAIYQQLYQGLGLPLQKPKSVYKIMWDVFRIVTNDFPELFMNRHIDHVILCCFYSVVKMCKGLVKELTFDRLLQAYGKVVESNDECPENYDRLLWRTNRTGVSSRIDKIAHQVVFDENSQSKGNLVDFYNTVFLAKMKVTILDMRIKYDISPPTAANANAVHSQDFSMSQSTAAPLSPGGSFRAASSSSSSSSASASSSFSCSSPERKGATPADIEMTPRTRELWASPGRSPPNRRQLRANRKAAMEGKGRNDRLRRLAQKQASRQQLQQQTISKSETMSNK